jgi:ribosomal protein S18 acetylase RimI-like enzyme
MACPAVVVRVAAGPDDLEAIGTVDLSYSTRLIYRVRRSDLGFWLEKESVDPPVTKTYPRPVPELSDRLVVASTGGQVAGYGELNFERWNGRARIEHLYVSARFRGQGVGRLLVRALAERARREPSARCLWLETQNLNYPAVRFYLRQGFELCGLDETLYQPGSPGLLPGEVALYFSRDLA